MMTNAKITGGVPGWDSGLYTLQPNSGQQLLFQGLRHSKPTSSPICYTETGPLGLTHESMLPLKDIEMKSWAFLLHPRVFLYAAISVLQTSVAISFHYFALILSLGVQTGKPWDAHPLS